MSEGDAKTDKKTSRGWILTVSVFVLLAVFLIAPVCFFFGLFGWSWLIFGGILSLLADAFIFGLFAYFRWAPNNLYFTFVPEGHAKTVVRGDGFDRALIQWKGFGFDKEWNVVKKYGWYKDGELLDVVEIIDKNTGKLRTKETTRDSKGNIIWVEEKDIEGAEERKERKKLLGGFRFYGFWPISSIYSYVLRWTSVHENGEPESHEGVLDSISLKDFVYFAQIKGAEEADKIPLDISILITLRVVNPYKALFVAHDWLEMVLNRIKPLFRNYVARHTYEDLLSEMKTETLRMWRELKDEGLIDYFRDKYGIEILEDAIKMKDIVPPPEHQRAATKKFLAQREAEERAEATLGAVLQMMMKGEGKSLEKIQDEIKNNPKKQKEFREKCYDLVHRKMGIDGGAYIDVRTSGEGGFEKSIMNLIAAWSKMPQGGGSKSNDPGREKRIREAREELNKKKEEEKRVKEERRKKQQKPSP